MMFGTSHFERALLIHVLMIALVIVSLLAGVISFIYASAVRWLHLSRSWTTRIASVGVGLVVTIPPMVGFSGWQEQRAQAQRARTAHAVHAQYQAFETSMRQRYQLIDVQAASIPFTTVTLTFSAPRQGRYHLHVRGSVQTTDHGYDVPAHVFEADRYHVELAPGTHQISVLSRHPEQLPTATALDFVVIVEPSNPQDRLITPAIPNAGSRRITEGVIYHAPLRSDGCSGSLYGELVCVTEPKLHLTLR
jgi:hypothetical protein